MHDAAILPEMSFLEAHLKYLMEDARRTPKLQLERAIGPLLTHFIARAMSGLTLTPENSDLAGHYRLICCEFPLKNTDNNQSINVDWLLLNETTGGLVFLELKTDMNSVTPKQISRYFDYMGGSVDFKGAIDEISENSRYETKYGHQLNKLDHHGVEVLKPMPIKLVYLAPHSASFTAPAEMQCQFRRICFADLPESIDGCYAREWTAIRRHLLCLDFPLPDIEAISCA
jgi:hypothetical protein